MPIHSYTSPRGSLGKIFCLLKFVLLPLCWRWMSFPVSSMLLAAWAQSPPGEERQPLRILWLLSCLSHGSTPPKPCSPLKPCQHLRPLYRRDKISSQTKCYSQLVEELRRVFGHIYWFPLPSQNITDCANLTIFLMALFLFPPIC